MAAAVGGKFTPACVCAFLGPLISFALFASAPPSAAAAVPSVFDGAIACSVQSNGTRFCGNSSPRSTVPSFDGVPIDVNVGLPPAPASGPDGNFPLLIDVGGYASQKVGYEDMRRWLEHGYAVLGLTMRGFHQSCGTAGARDAAPQACEPGYVRMMDTRYEVRDAQHLVGELVDDGVVAPGKVGATGGSYGGGLALALAALRNRVMLPNGSLVPWQSPGGTSIQLAAAVPLHPWTDLPAILLENGSRLDYLANSPYAGRPGVARTGVVDLFADPCETDHAYCAPAGSDPNADIRNWEDWLAGSDSYDGDADVVSMIAELSAHHSAYAINPSVAPAPTLITSGFTDDLVPVSEALPFYSRNNTLFPNAPLGVFLADAGHARAQNPPAIGEIWTSRAAWLDHYVRGLGPEPFRGVTAVTQVCGGATAQRFRESDWASVAPGEIRLTHAAAKVVTPAGADADIAQVLSPETTGAACNEVDGGDRAGAASYRLPAAPSGGYTLAGSPTAIVDITNPAAASQLAARLLDVAPDGDARLVARAVWRPAVSSSAVRQVFQLSANGWRFEAGHVAKLELIPNEGSFWRKSTNQQNVTVANLDLRLPVREEPGSLGGLVGAPAAKVVPPGAALARQYLSGVKVTKLGTGEGRVVSSPSGIDCGPTCSALYPTGTPVTLTAEPAPGTRFAGWSGECSGTGTCMVVAGPTASVSGTFHRQRRLVVHAVGAGTISAPSPAISCATTDCEYTLDEGTQMTLTATPAADHRFVGWSGNACAGTSPTCQMRLDGDRAVVAYFAEREPATSPPGGGRPPNPLLPDTQLTRAKVTSAKRKALFRFEGVWGAAPAVAFNCRLDKRKWKRCESPEIYRRLKRGKHVFRVAAVRSDGLADASPAKHHFRIRR